MGPLAGWPASAAKRYILGMLTLLASLLAGESRAQTAAHAEEGGRGHHHSPLRSVGGLERLSLVMKSRDIKDKPRLI